MLKENLKKILSFDYDDRPFSDSLYDFNSLWIKPVNDYYFRVEHAGHTEEVLSLARQEHVIFISNHAITLEAPFIGYFLLKNDAGKVGTLIYPEAFKLPFIREFFRGCQCVPISINKGVETLQQRHVLVFPEGLDFISGFANPDRIPRFHKGFLVIAKKYLEITGKDSVAIIPIAHVGLQNAIKLWIIKNRFFIQKVVQRFVNYPFFVFPKLPFIFPNKVIMQWGSPVRVSLKDLKNEKTIGIKMNYFRSTIKDLKMRAQERQKSKKSSHFHL